MALRGHNEIYLNTHTMIDAMQEWVDRNFVASPKPRVIGVKEIGSVVTQFRITLSDPSPDAGEQE